VDHASSPFPPLRRSIVDAALSYAELKSFFECGFVIARSMVGPEQGVAAQKMANYWLSKYIYSTRGDAAGGGAVATSPSTGSGSGSAGSDGILRGPLNSVELIGSICADVDILALFYATPVVHIVQRLLGAGDVAHPLSARVVTTFPTLELVDSPALYGNKWTIEGFTATGGHSPYSLLVGVALTDIAESDHGNFCVHSGSHMSLLEEYQAQVSMELKWPNTWYAVRKMSLVRCAWTCAQIAPVLVESCAVFFSEQSGICCAVRRMFEFK
jgi:hypothetical protein